MRADGSPTVRGGCGAAFNLPQGTDRFWCTECAGGGYGHTAVLVWPDSMTVLARNLETLPTMLQFWPCAACRPHWAQGRAVCDTCQGVQGGEI